MRCEVAGVVIAATVLVAISTTSARTWYILPDGTGDAPTIQAGVDSAVAGDTVLVAPGTYYDCTYTDPTGRKACVNMKSGITLRSDTGDPTSTIIDAQQEGRVIRCDSVAGAVIDGLTLTGGLAYTGGGMLCRETDVALTNIVFSGNTAEGGIPNGGGGLYVLGEIEPTVSGCVFSDNTAGWYGGGVWVKNPNLEVVFTECIFRDNRADNYGGGLCCTSGEMNLFDCWLEGNIAEAGGGIAYLSFEGGTVLRCVLSLNRAYCIGYSGAAIHQEWGNVLVARSTLYANRCDAIVVWGECSMVVRRTIVTASPGRSLRMIPDYEILPEAWMECCDFYGNAGGDWGPGIGDQLGRWGNICENPLFCDSANADFTLDEASPCAPDNSPESCDLIGARPVGCAHAGVDPGEGHATTWGAIKALYK